MLLRFRKGQGCDRKSLKGGREDNMGDLVKLSKRGAPLKEGGLDLITCGEALFGNQMLHM